MWQTILTGSIVIFLIRTLPAVFSGINNLKNYPRLNKFLDYTICLVTGEVIYSLAFSKSDASNLILHNILIITTLLLAASLMWLTGKLSKSLLLSSLFFITGYRLLC